MLAQANFSYIFLVFLLGFCSIAATEEVELPQGDKISIDILQKLQAAHEVAVNQKVQEDLFISLPLVAPNQSDSVTVANSTKTISSPRKLRHRKIDSNATLGVDNVKRQLECDAELWYEGQDPCEGLEEEAGFVPCDPPCQFDLNYFMQQVVNPPRIDECLFYTAGLSTTAQDYRRRHNAGNPQTLVTTIWDIWPGWMYVGDQVITNRMRCIIQDNVFEGRINQVRTGYFQRMSDSMAYMCGGTAAVMDRNMRRGRTGRVKQAGIWFRVEFPRLKMAGADKWTDPAGVNRVVNRVDAIGENLPNEPDTQIFWRSWWVRGGPDWPSQASQPLKRRDVNETYDATLVEERSLHKREIDSSVFDEGGRWEVVW